MGTHLPHFTQRTAVHAPLPRQQQHATEPFLVASHGARSDGRSAFPGNGLAAWVDRAGGACLGEPVPVLEREGRQVSPS
jgi:hypothetical protein